MGKFYSMLLAMLTVCTLAQAQVFFDATVTMGSNTSASGADEVSKDGVTIATTAGGFATGQQYRFAKGSETTFTSTVGKITKIVFTCTAEGDAKYGPGCFDAQDGYTYDGKVGTWTGSADEVKFVAGAAQVRAVTIAVSIDGKDPEGGEEPGEEPVDPQPATAIDVTCAQAVELTNALADGATSTDTYAVTGYITEVVSNVSRNQQTFWMADTKDGGQVFEAYWANLPEGVSEFKVGSKVKITGQLMKYVKGEAVTPEIKNADVVILEEGGDTPTPQPEMGEWESSATAPLVVAHALELAATLDASTKSPANVCVKGIISEITEVNTQYGNATYYISDDGTTDQQLLVYRGYGVDGAKFEAEDALAVGDHVIVCGQIVNFKGETLEFTTGSSILSLKPAAVSVVKADAAEGVIYTIAGQRVPAITRHGLYIVGGKKVVK